MESDRKPDSYADDLLQAALTRRGRQEDRPGLEDRILANLEHKAAAQPEVWPGWRLALAAATAVVLLMVGLRLAQKPAALPSAPSSAAERAAPAEVAAIKAPEPAAVPNTESQPPPESAPAKTVRPPAALPRLERFPAPATLSEQGLLLLAYVERAPKETLLALNASATVEENVRIEPLRIPALVVERLPSLAEESTASGGIK